MWEYKNLSRMWGADRKICHCLASQGFAEWCQHSDPKGRIFLSAPHTHEIPFLTYLWSPVFDFYVGGTCSYMLTSAILTIDVNTQSLKDRFRWPPIPPIYWQHVFLFLSLKYRQASIVRRRQHFQTTSPLKSLSRFLPYFTYSIYRQREWTILFFVPVR